MVEIKDILIEQFGAEVIIEETTGLMHILTVPAQLISEICSFLKTNHQTYFDSLSCLTAIDNGPEKNTMEIVYNLYSIPYDIKIALKVVLERKTGELELPQVSSVSNIWHAANWHEREAFDLLGLNFIGHPNLKRILMPNDWEGHPLRKDYEQQELYHGITVKY